MLYKSPHAIDMLLVFYASIRLAIVVREKNAYQDGNTGGETLHRVGTLMRRERPRVHHSNLYVSNTDVL